MRILYVMDVCEVGTILVHEAAQKKVEAHVVNYTWGVLKAGRFLDFLRFLMKHSIRDFDVYHFNYPSSTFLPFHKDIRLLKKGGKKVFVHYHGDDIRNKKESEALKTVDGKFISTLDLKKFVSDAEWLPFPYNIRTMRERTGWNSPLQVIHAPSDRRRKGTTHILKAVKELQRKYDIAFELIEGKPKAYVLQKMAEADIVVDQLGPGWYGKVTLEALYWGAVSCFYMDPDLFPFVPAEFFQQITEETIVPRIAEVIEEESLRDDLRRKGYEYMRTYHDSQKIMERLLNRYQHE